jgi:signal transduction histidine kinase
MLAAAAAAATVLGTALTVAVDGGRAGIWGLVTPTVTALVLAALGALLAGRPAGRRVGWLFLLGAWAHAASCLGGGYAALGRAGDWPGVDAVDHLSSEVLWVGAVIPLTTVLLAVFPDGRAVSPRWRLLTWLGWAATAAVGLGAGLGSTGLIAVGGALWTAAGAGGVAALTVRWRRSRGVARQQVAYLLLAALVVCLIYAIADLLPMALRQVAFLIVPLSLLGAVALAVLRYRLYDVDVALRRTAVFTGLTVLVFATYLGVGAALGTGPSERAALIAALLVAAVAEPVRRRLQRAITRLLYGRRDEPLAALAVLRDRLRAATDADALAGVVADVLPSLLRTRRAELRLLTGGASGATEGSTSDDGAVEFPLVHQSELLGTLAVEPREPGVPFGRADTVLLTELAHQVAAAAHAVRLTEELRAAADGTARAAAHEREQLRRDLHDRLGPLLVGTGLGVEGLRRAAGPGPDAEALAEIAGQLRSASGEVRRIVDRLAPAALLDLGLPRAVRDHLDRLSRLPGAPSFEVTSDIDVPVPAAVAQAAYAVVLEAVTNALRHAGATRVRVALTRSDGSLHVAVDDDGAGLAEPWTAGVGVGSMRRRALELGGSFALGPGPRGGTRVHATVPLEEPWPIPPRPSGSSSPTTTPSSGSACDGSSTPCPVSSSSGRPPTPTPRSQPAATSTPTSS